MENFKIQVMLKDGSLTDYDVYTKRGEDQFNIWQNNACIAEFKANPDGSWTLTDNPGAIDTDLQHRISNQLNGLLR